MSFLFEELTREECEAIREQDGFYRGLEVGKAEGIIEVKLETAKIMKSEGESIEKIVKYTGLTEEEIETL